MNLILFFKMDLKHIQVLSVFTQFSYKYLNIFLFRKIALIRGFPMRNHVKDIKLISINISMFEINKERKSF